MTSRDNLDAPPPSARSVRFSPMVSRSITPDFFNPPSASPSFDALSQVSDSSVKSPLLPRPVGAPTQRRRDYREQIASAFTIFCLCVLVGVFLTIIVKNRTGRPPRRGWDDNNEDGLYVTGKNGAVSSDVDVCSQIGVELLKKGGNAVDAAIGTGACIGTINMFASGIGGGGFMVVRMGDGDSASFNFREMAPGNASYDMYGHSDQASKVGGLAVAVPGELHGFYTAHEKYGKLPWNELWEPSIWLNEHGFEVTATLERIIHTRDNPYIFAADRKQWSFLFNENTGELAKEGDTIFRPAYARTLRAIAGTPEDPYSGVRDFYNGTLAERLSDVIQIAHGIVTPEDFSAYFTEVTDVVSSTVFNKTVYTCSPPCSGQAMLEGLNIASHLPESFRHPSAESTPHYVVETMKWLSAGRTELGDPMDPIVANNSERIAELLQQDYAAAVVQNISEATTYSWQHYKPSYEPNDSHGTSHLSVIDKDGAAVAMTTTVNLYWGAMLHDPSTGIVLNSQMDDFSLPGRSNAYLLRPSVYNYILPRKRPLSSTTPTIITAPTNGTERAILSIGGSGGSRIVTGVFEAIIKRVLWDYSLLDTIRSERLHHQLVPEVVFAESGVSDRVVGALQMRGHTVERKGRNEAAGGSVIQAVAWEEGSHGGEGIVVGVADWWRKGGKAKVY